MPTKIGRRQFLSGAALTFAGGMLAACSSSSSTGASSVAPSAAAGKFTLWNYASQLTDAINTGFVPAHKKISTEVVQLALPDVQSKLLVSLAAGTGLPDAATLSSRTSDQFLKAGSSFAEWSDAELKKFGDGFGNALIRYDGKVYGLPMNDGRLGYWVNTATLEKYGIDASTLTTFDAIAEAGKKLNTDSNGASKLIMVPNGTNGADYFSTLLAGAGGNWWDSKGKLVEDQSTALTVLEFLVDAVKNEIAQVTDWTQPTFFNLIKTNQLSSFGMNFTIGASNLPKNVPEQSGQWQMLKWPKWKKSDPQKTVSYGMTFVGVLSEGNVAAGKEFASWWYTKEGLPLLQQGLGTLAYAPAAKLDTVQKGYDYFGGQKVIADLTSQPMIVPNYFNWSKTEQVVGYAVDQAILGKMSPKAAIDYCTSSLKGAS